MMKYTLILISVVLFCCTKGISQENIPINDSTLDPGSSQWVDSVLLSLSTEEKIAQLMMIRTYSNKNQEYYKSIEQTINKYNIGGLCFFQGGPIEQAKLTNHYQSIAKTPLFIALDAEWGLGMRLDSTHSFPFQMTMGSMSNDEAIYSMGVETAKQLKMIGTHINFAPVVDVNNNPNNPVINSRSFGENRYSVTQKGIAYMMGLKDNGIIATAKHFPGHGDTESDSHYTLPVINHSKERLDSVELYPFIKMVEAGLDAVMIAHLFVPSLDSTVNTPTTLSKNVVDGLLKEKIGFKGLVITDALDMKGVTSYYKPGEIELKALLAGNDILLLPQDINKAINKIKEAVDQGLVNINLIDQKCRKILNYKFKAGLNKVSPVSTDSLYQQLNNVNNELITREIYESAITVLKNENNLVPIKKLDTLKIASLSIGSPEISSFQLMLNNYSQIKTFNILKNISSNQQEKLLKDLDEFNLIIIGLHGTSIYPQKNFSISEQSIHLINNIAKNKKVIVATFSSPLSLRLFDQTENFNSFLLAHQDDKIAHEIAAQIIMGSIDGKGTLPISISDQFKIGSGIQTKAIHRLKYTIPEEVGINSYELKKIDSIALFNIKEKAIPGCQILIAKDGMVIYQKSFGYHTYNKGQFVKNDDLYDLASITKIAATTLSVMKLCDNKKLDIDHRMSWTLPYLRGTNKESMIIREMMAHQAKLTPWIPFYLNTFKDNKPDPDLYSHTLNDNYTVKVADNLYLRKDYQFALYDSIATSELRKRKKYKYSDLGFYLLKQSIEYITNQPLDRYVRDNFYASLGLQTMCFNPRDYFKVSRIIPTEDDNYFRYQLVHGYVHDPGAAMLGGVSGHAGLFSNANDLAILMQMLLLEGEYGGENYIRSSTVKQFTKQQFPLNKNRRGIGFDKPNIEDKTIGPTCESVSDHSFGHTGFTGTYAWADPEFEIIYIFLSNRVNPTASNTKLLKMNTRTEIQQIIYDLVGKIEKETAPTQEIDAVRAINN